MKIYLTTYQLDGDEYAGPNIHALNWKMASQIADHHGLIVSGVLEDIHTFNADIEEELVKIIAEHEFLHDINSEKRTLH